jgi:hypothetical protein
MGIDSRHIMVDSHDKLLLDYFFESLTPGGGYPYPGSRIITLSAVQGNFQGNVTTNDGY